MIESPSGWVLAPAYDLLNVTIVNPNDEEELALTLTGKKKKLRREHFEQLGEGLGLTDRQIAGAFKRTQKNKAKALSWIERSFLSKEMKGSYNQGIEKRYAQLDCKTKNTRS